VTDRAPHTHYCAVLDELIALLDLQPLLKIPVLQLRLGRRVRCDLTAVLVHEPSVLFLDATTISLEAISKLAVRGYVRQLNRNCSVTVVITTYDLDDIEALCHRVLVMGPG
jgi:ABC-2 type transport system ATP-binding protein